MNSVGRTFLTVFFGILGLIAPFGGMFVATFGQKSDLSVFNSTMVMLLSVLLIVFLMINCFNNFNNNNKKMFIIGLILFFLCVVSFLYNLVLFINLP